jgi:hypothetical protein
MNLFYINIFNKQFCFYLLKFLEDGGLGVRQLKEFNIALLGKWCWRLLVDRGGLWYRVLVARYGEEAGRLGAGSCFYLVERVSED